MVIVEGFRATLFKVVRISETKLFIQFKRKGRHLEAAIVVYRGETFRLGEEVFFTSDRNGQCYLSKF